MSEGYGKFYDGGYILKEEYEGFSFQRSTKGRVKKWNKNRSKMQKASKKRNRKKKK